MVLSNEEALVVGFLNDYRSLVRNDQWPARVVWRAALRAAIAFEKETTNKEAEEP